MGQAISRAVRVLLESSRKGATTLLGTPWPSVRSFTVCGGGGIWCVCSVNYLEFQYLLILPHQWCLPASFWVLSLTFLIGILGTNSGDFFFAEFSNAEATTTIWIFYPKFEHYPFGVVYLSWAQRAREREQILSHTHAILISLSCVVFTEHPCSNLEQH